MPRSVSNRKKSRAVNVRQYIKLPSAAPPKNNSATATPNTAPTQLPEMSDSTSSPIISDSNTPAQTMPISIAKSPDAAGYSISVLRLS